MKYLRSYPWGMQLLFFMLLVFSFFVAASIIIPGLLTKLFDISMLQIEGINAQSSFKLINIAILTQGFSSIIIFLLPGYIFAYLFHPQPRAYLGLVAPGKNIQIILVILLMIGAIPVLQFLEGLISKINFGEGVRKSQQENDEMMGAFLNMPTLWAFLKAFTVMAIIPAFGEEIFFRGVMMRFAKRNSKNMIFPIVFSAIVFAMAHSNIYGYLSIFLAGLLLGTIYYLTGSLWCSILAHLFFNGSQITLAYLGSHSKMLKHFLDGDSLVQLVPFVIVGLLVFIGSLFLLLKNKTPLPNNWPQDFTEEELSVING